jgi:hypothetical protein
MEPVFERITRVQINDKFFMREIYFPNQFKLSKYLIGYPMYNIIEKLYKMFPNYSLLCVGYNDNCGGDFQIGITGKIKTNESSYDAVKREIKEELGLICDLADSVEIDKNIFIINSSKIISNLISVYPNTEKDTTQKICGLIIGTHEELINLMSFPSYRNFSDDQQNINHVMIVSLYSCLKMINLIKKSGNIFDGIPILYSI